MSNGILNNLSIADYSQIINKFKGDFSNSLNEDIGEIIIHLKLWVNHGRNPLMHSRLITVRKYQTTISAIKFIEMWIKNQLVINKS
ncbi:MAG: hypothetical protein HeimC3_32030 [Candidatus Heimdallarchaeota archaeon LC_3]|nr:MAG: hypothetical protein HeimC3_32030 [Candidatus Heimdallarchaeota archaeon LC_3]